MDDVKHQLWSAMVDEWLQRMPKRPCFESTWGPLLHLYCQLSHRGKMPLDRRELLEMKEEEGSTSGESRGKAAEENDGSEPPAPKKRLSDLLQDRLVQS